MAQGADIANRNGTSDPVEIRWFGYFRGVASVSLMLLLDENEAYGCNHAYL